GKRAYGKRAGRRARLRPRASVHLRRPRKGSAGKARGSEASRWPLASLLLLVDEIVEKPAHLFFDRGFLTLGRPLAIRRHGSRRLGRGTHFLEERRIHILFAH